MPEWSGVERERKRSRRVEELRRTERKSLDGSHATLAGLQRFGQGVRPGLELRKIISFKTELECLKSFFYLLTVNM